MLLHSIIKYKAPLALYQTVVPSRNAARYDKLGYATFLSTIRFTKGSIIRNKFLELDIIPESAQFVVVDIQEIHFMCEQGEKEPKCLLIENSAGTKFWTEPWRWTELTDKDITC